MGEAKGGKLAGLKIRGSRAPGVREKDRTSCQDSKGGHQLQRRTTGRRQCKNPQPRDLNGKCLSKDEQAKEEKKGLKKKVKSRDQAKVECQEKNSS